MILNGQLTGPRVDLDWQKMCVGSGALFPTTWPEAKGGVRINSSVNLTVTADAANQTKLKQELKVQVEWIKCSWMFFQTPERRQEEWMEKPSYLCLRCHLNNLEELPFCRLCETGQGLELEGAPWGRAPPKLSNKYKILFKNLETYQPTIDSPVIGKYWKFGFCHL